MNRYPDAIAKLFALNTSRGMKFGLENVRRLNEKLGFPSHAFPSVHVAGTNGKGSVVVKVAKGLESKYAKVGLYISPHISTFRERISINGEIIPEEAVVNGLAKIWEISDREGLLPTFFELTTLLAFKHFADSDVDYAVIETGLGGRLDATNILHPSLTIITSIDYDHMDILGNSLEAIAREKAGIIKPKVPVILGPTASIVQVHKNCPYRVIRQKFDTVENENRAIAEAALKFLKVPDAAIRKALTARLPCRREKVGYDGHEVILDVAHNPAGLNALFSELRIPKEKLQAVFGLSKTKDLETCLQILHTHAKELHLVDAPNGRCAEPERLKKLLLIQGVAEERIHIQRDIDKTLKSALYAPDSAGSQILVTGTFFIMAEARKSLGIDEPRDPVDINERLFERVSSKF